MIASIFRLLKTNLQISRSLFQPRKELGSENLALRQQSATYALKQPHPKMIAPVHISVCA